MSDNDLPVTETQRWNHFHIQPIHTIALSADCHFLAAASADGTISIMDLVHNLPPHIAHFDIGTVPVAISWMPGCRLVVFASSGLLLLADVNATDAVELKVSTWLPLHFRHPVSCFAANGTGRQAAICHANTIELWSREGIEPDSWVAVYEASIGQNDAIIGIWFLDDYQLLVCSTTGVYTWLPNKTDLSVPVLAIPLAEMETACWAPTHGNLAVGNSEGTLAVYHILISPVLIIQKLAFLKALPSIHSIRITGPRDLLYETRDGDLGEVHHVRVFNDLTSSNSIRIFSAMPDGIVAFDASTTGDKIAVACSADDMEWVELWVKGNNNGDATIHEALGVTLPRTNLAFEVYRAKTVFGIVGGVPFLIPLVAWSVQVVSHWLPRGALTKLRPGWKTLMYLFLFLLVGWLLHSFDTQLPPENDLLVLALALKRVIIFFADNLFNGLMTLLKMLLAVVLTCVYGYLEAGARIFGAGLPSVRLPSAPLDTVIGAIDAATDGWNWLLGHARMLIVAGW